MQLRRQGPVLLNGAGSPSVMALLMPDVLDFFAVFRVSCSWDARPYIAGLPPARRYLEPLWVM